MYQTLRSVSACLAILLGAALIGRLWLVALDAVSLGGALCGVLFLLLALGLMGQRRLSLVLTAGACIPMIITSVSINDVSAITLGEVLLFSLCLILLSLYPKHQQRAEI